MLKPLRLALAATLSLAALHAHAGDTGIVVDDPYARVSRPNGPTGAAFMQITNQGNQDDRLVAARFEGARTTELHTHLMDPASGVAKMRPVEDGFAIAAGKTISLMRGGDHVMFMGLSAPLVDGETITVTLEFETAGEIVVEIPVDSQRKAEHGGMDEKHGSNSN